MDQIAILHIEQRITANNPDILPAIYKQITLNGIPCRACLGLSSSYSLFHFLAENQANVPEACPLKAEYRISSDIPLPKSLS